MESLHCDIDFMELLFDQVDFIEETAVCLGTTYVRPPPIAIPEQVSIFPDTVLFEEDTQEIIEVISSPE